MAHLRGTLDHLARSLFGADAITRWRPSYFPFTEPSAEFDVWFPSTATARAGSSGAAAGWSTRGCSSPAASTRRSTPGSPSASGIERALQFRSGVGDMRDIVEGDVRFTRAFGVDQ